MKCEYCNNGHNGGYATGRFCSSECAHAFSTQENRQEINKKVSISLKGRKPTAIIIGTKRTWKNEEDKEKWITSLKQHARKIFEDKIEGWKNGENIGLGTIKRYLIEKYGNKCSKCSWSKINKNSGKVPIELNHIDGIFKNNLESNLEILCPNCHSLTPTFRGLNRGNGREYRRKNADVA